jgi:hypothetical protein
MTVIQIPGYVTISENDKLMTFLNDMFENGDWCIQNCNNQISLLIFKYAEDATLFTLGFERPLSWDLHRVKKNMTAVNI